MKFYTHKSPRILKAIYSQFLWRVDTQKKEIYLTFDDGPSPSVTRYVLDQLDKFNAKATFFVVGENVKKFSDVLLESVAKGHQIGNHTQHHVSGWKLSVDDYLKNIQECQEVLEELGVNKQKLFRPPYGRITFKQSVQVRKNYKVVMWDMLSGDFDSKLNLNKATDNLNSCLPGSIVVFHDNPKHVQNLKQLLAPFLKEYSDRGFTFKTIS